MKLVVEKRDLKTSPHSLRLGGSIPAVVYGRSQEATPITVNRKDFEKLFRAAGESSVITLTGLEQDKEALIQDVSVHAVSGAPLHVDFYAIQKGQKVTVSVPLEYEGISPAVKDLGGILVKVMHEIEIEVPPADLPHAVMVDISALTRIDSKITVADLTLPKTATLSADLEEVVAMISQADDAPIVDTTMDLSQIEVEKKGKKEEDAEGVGEEE